MDLQFNGLIWLCLVFTILHSACRGSQPILTVETPVETVESNGNGQEDIILFLMFNMVKDTVDNSNAISSFQVFESSGKLKETLADSPSADQFLLCILSTAGQPKKDSFYLEHPLHKNVEFVNDQMQLSRKQIELGSAEFFVRIQKENYSIIQIFEFSNYIRNNDLGSFYF